MIIKTHLNRNISLFKFTGVSGQKQMYKNYAIIT